MACEVPVVCENRGGYSDLIEHGKNGFSFETTDEAVQLVRRLKEDPELCARIGRAGRETVERLYDPEHFRQRLREIFLSD
jgi:glycosyltransferase involved in cell wall biosynthesis